MQVRMLVGISGSRHDGRPWPACGVTLEVPDWEGYDLIRGGNAEAAGSQARRKYEEMAWGPANDAPPAEAPAEAAQPAAPRQLPGAAPAPAPSAPETPQPAPVRDDGPAPGESAGKAAGPAAVPASRDEPPAGAPAARAPSRAEPPAAEVPAPGPSSPKQSWIDYAISQGAAEDTAAAMTKADLMSKYGGRL